MSDFYARTIFFVTNAEESMRFYRDRLGFKVDWQSVEDGVTYVLQVSLFGFELILNKAWGRTLGHQGHGRIFIGLEDDQGEPLRRHIKAHGIATRRADWGRPTLVMNDPDNNELFFWIPRDDFTDFGVTVDESSGNLQPPNVIFPSSQTNP